MLISLQPDDIKFNVHQSDIIVPPKAIYSTMIIDVNGFLAKKGSVLYIFVGIKQLIFARDDLCY